jgi:acetate kinase
MNNILVINAGSSSLKYQLIDMDQEKVVAKGNAERIGITGSKLTHNPMTRPAVTVETPMDDHVAAIRLVLEALTDKEHGVIGSMDEINAVGHRVVHGGEKFSASVIIDDEVIAALEENIPLAPLHNPANLMGIRACRAVMPDTPMVGVFDTAFHQTMPPKAYLYGLPYDYYTRLKVRRYGFHGTSHRYVTQKVAACMGKKPEELKIITCHLGNGGSITAVDGGKSVDTTMGMTPLEGIMMGTRSGSLDPAIIEYIMENDDKSINQVMDVLNKQSGLLGISGLSSDMRDVVAGMKAGNERATMAFKAFCYRVTKYIGAFAAAMGGVDVVVFTAGIGENMAIVREEVCRPLAYMGIKFSPERNNAKADEMLISTDDSPVQVWVIATDEELMIARDTLELVSHKE